MEVWKPVPRNETTYEISNMGFIRRIADHKPIRAYITNKGYLTLKMRGPDGKRISRSVHSIVAEAFLGPREGKMQVNHKNGDKLDNRAENLEWVSAAMNVRHAIAIGLVDYSTKGSPIGHKNQEQRGAKNFNARLSEPNVREIKSRISAGHKKKDIADAFSVSPSLVYAIANGRRWAHL